VEIGWWLLKGYLWYCGAVVALGLVLICIVLATGHLVLWWRRWRRWRERHGRRQAHPGH
jgi:hypothetical protein